ncbi:hypothetical protein NQ317_006883 [Molorchus minor]|uniref:V-type proton ATPase subunit C n=1 Tax=Molorchus minor TaxID=1323400 RepID=A0ABQ9JK99_9CUCU|nr:hypothetical protein NQ317_006883 [Molorchus minor]
MIVPRSSQLIIQDNEYGLFTVTLFKKVIDEFKLHAREKKFIVREFIYDKDVLAAGKNEITKLVTDKKKQFIWFAGQFSGHDNPSSQKVDKRLREVLNQLYGHLDSSAALSGSNVDSVDIPGLSFGQSEYYPYVYYKINVDMIETQKI